MAVRVEFLSSYQDYLDSIDPHRRPAAADALFGASVGAHG